LEKEGITLICRLAKNFKSQSQEVMNVNSNPPEIATIYLLEGSSGGKKQDVPIDILAGTLIGFQNIVYILAAASNNQEISSLRDISPSLKKQFLLNAKPAVSSSHATPVLFANVDASQDFLTQEVEKLFSFIRSGNFESVLSLLPSNKSRNKILLEVRKIFNRLEDWGDLGFSLVNKDKIVIDPEQALLFISNLLEDYKEPVMMTVTGLLSGTKFRPNTKAALYYEPTQKEIEFSYRKEDQKLLDENRDNLIQITGLFNVDADLHPRKFVGGMPVISKLDLSPINLDVIQWGGRVFKLKYPVSLQPTLSNSDQLIAVESLDLGINVFGATREQIMEEIGEQISFMWDIYVLEKDSKLTQSAIELKNRLVKFIGIVSDGI
jgi:hypothetical protein